MISDACVTDALDAVLEKYTWKFVTDATVREFTNNASDASYFINKELVPA